MNKGVFIYPSAIVKIFFWTPAIFLLGFYGVYTLLNYASTYSVIDWLFNSYPLEAVSDIFYWWMRFILGWLFCISVWFMLLGAKSKYTKTYPPERMPIPFKTAQLEGKSAEEKKGGGGWFYFIGFIIFFQVTIVGILFFMSR